MRASTALALPVFLACASASSSNSSTQQRVVARTNDEVLRSYESTHTGTAILNATPDRVLTALKAAYADLGIEVKLFDPPRGQVGNQNFNKMYRLARTPLSQYVGCGQTTMGAAADSYRITMSLVSQVTPVPGGSRVDTQLEARADDMASSKGSISCQTLGTLEAKVNELATEHLSG